MNIELIRSMLYNKQYIQFGHNLGVLTIHPIDSNC